MAGSHPGGTKYDTGTSPPIMALATSWHVTCPTVIVGAPVGAAQSGSAVSARASRTIPGTKPANPTTATTNAQRRTDPIDPPSALSRSPRPPARVPRPTRGLTERAPSAATSAPPCGTTTQGVL